MLLLSYGVNSFNSNGQHAPIIYRILQLFFCSLHSPHPMEGMMAAFARSDNRVRRRCVASLSSHRSQHSRSDCVINWKYTFLGQRDNRFDSISTKRSRKSNRTWQPIESFDDQCPAFFLCAEKIDDWILFSMVFSPLNHNNLWLAPQNRDFSPLSMDMLISSMNGLFVDKHQRTLSEMNELSIELGPDGITF